MVKRRAAAAAAAVLKSPRTPRTAQSSAAGSPPRGSLSPRVFRHPTAPLALHAHAKYLVSMHRAAPNSWAFLDGVRVISMLWIFFSHLVILLVGYADWSVVPDLQRYLGPASPVMLLVSGGQFPVDTFFFLSAFLLGVRGWPLLQREGSGRRRAAAVALVLARRFFRVWPVLVVMVLSAPLFLQFPVHNARQDLMVNQAIRQMECDIYWWKPLLMLNNIFPSMEHCVGWSWYISNDSQFFFGALVLMAICAGLPAKRRVKTLVRVLWAVGALCAAYSSYSCYTSDWLFLGNFGFTHLPRKNLHDMMLLDHIEHDTGLWTYFNNFYTYPWNRVFPYLIGLGYGIRVADRSAPPSGSVATSSGGLTTRALTRRAADDFCDEDGRRAAGRLHEFRQACGALEDDDDRFAGAVVAGHRRGSYVPPSVASDSWLWTALGMAACIVCPVWLKNEQRLARSIYTVGTKLLWAWMMCRLCSKGKALSADGAGAGWLHRKVYRALAAELWLPLTRISFGFYLWHVAVVTPMLYLLMLHPESYNPLHSWWSAFVALSTFPLTVLAAAVSYVVIETPARLAGDAALRWLSHAVTRKKRASQ